MDLKSTNGLYFYEMLLEVACFYFQRGLTHEAYDHLLVNLCARKLLGPLKVWTHVNIAIIQLPSWYYVVYY